jgi:hypothetical protein
VLYGLSLFSIAMMLMTIESSLISALSNAGAWGVVALVLLWYARQREKDIETARAREESLKTENTALQQKRVDDVRIYADALRELVSEQHEVIKESALAMQGLRELLEMMRQEGYSIRKPSSQPTDQRKA